MGLDKKELARLAPEERIRKLKELEKSRRDDLQEAEKLIRESIEELQSSVDIEGPPEAKPRDIKDLLESQLEETLKEEPVPDISELTNERQQLYIIESYNELRDLHESGQAYHNPERAFGLYRQIMEVAKYQAQNEIISKIAMGSSRLMEQVLGDEKGKVKYFP